MPKAEYLQYGGQAVIEGVMMRSPRFFAVACRAPNQEIVCRTEPVEKTWIGRQRWLKLPFLRGSLALLDAMALGIKALQFASRVQLDEQYEGSGPPKEERVSRTAREIPFWLGLIAVNAIVGILIGPAIGSAVVAKLVSMWHSVVSPKGLIILGAAVVLGLGLTLRPKKAEEKADSKGAINEIAVGGAMVMGLGLGVLLFVVLPTAAVDAFKAHGWTTAQLNLLDVGLRFLIFLDYVALISLMPDIYRVFQYHGAEHKAINTLEARQELTRENALRQTRLHQRCGTSFIVIVLLLSLLVFPFLPRPEIWLRVPLHIAILFPIAGVAYEALRLAGRMKGSLLCTVLFWPGLLTQFLTTREPNERQVDVALEALRAVVDQEGIRPTELVVA
ncbi:MAG: hypothetical protein AMXMBFR61_24150 [Fimbriimonadales bacterium]